MQLTCCVQLFAIKIINCVVTCSSGGHHHQHLRNVQFMGKKSALYKTVLLRTGSESGSNWVGTIQFYIMRCFNFIKRTCPDEGSIRHQNILEHILIV